MTLVLLGAVRTLSLLLLIAVTALAGEPKAKKLFPKGAQEANPNELTVYEYEDASGLQQVETLAEVPPKFRAKAKRITMTRSESSARSEPARLRETPKNGSPVYRGQDRASSNESGPTRAQAAPAAQTVVYCQYSYNRGMAPMKASYCTSGSVSAANETCEKQTFERFKEAIPCSCTDDKTYISTRCN